ncbi:MAG: CotH kinase family protein [Deltaproteobacteria bacterium]|nr:CotH kinase family protein [Deltaproteobacteria bacterium]
MRLRPPLLAALLLPLLPLGGCTASGAGGGGSGLCAADPADLERPAHWTVASHCKGEAPDYDLLFDDTAVRRLDLIIGAETWQAMQDDLDQLLSTRPPPGGSTADPAWVEVDLEYEGLRWERVGMRYKGNSSLRFAYERGVDKKAFRLNFDKFSDDTPETVNQRFFGFKKMTFSNGFADESLMRDKLAADLFRSAGVPAARGAFVRVYFDLGEGPVFAGLYTMIDDPADEVLGSQFADDTGNLYKPEGDAAHWTRFDAAAFEKKTNETSGDTADVEAAIAALNAATTDAATWRANLEAAFDVEGFLLWLAANQVLENWDTYGWMTHNYYLYGDPSQGGRIVWIPWDLNEALKHRDSPMATNADSVLLDEIGSEWPLIRRLLDDPVYRARYQEHLRALVDGPLAEATVTPLAQAYHELIAPYVVGPESTETPPFSTLPPTPGVFGDSVEGSLGILPHLAARRAAVEAALAP